MAKTNMIEATNVLIMTWSKIDPIKLVSINKNDIRIYNASISVGWINPVNAATVNLTFEVAQKTNVLNP